MSRSPFNRLPAFIRIIRGEGIHLRPDQLLLGLLPWILAPILGVLIAALIVREAWHLLVPLILLTPTLVLVGRYPFSAILIWILIAPFFVETPGRLERYAYYVVHRALIPGALGYVIISRGLGVDRRKEPPKLGGAELAMLGFLGLAVANILLLGSTIGGNIVHLYDHVFVPFCAYLLARLIAPDEEDFRLLLWVAFFTVITQAAIGFLGWYSPQVLPSQWLTRQGERTTGTFGSPAVYSTTLIFLSLLLFQRGMQRNQGKLRALLPAVFALALFCVVLTFSRGSWLAGAVVLLGLVFLYPKATIRLTVIAATLALVLSGTLLTDEASWARERLTTEETAEGRIILFNTGLGLVTARPLFGWGYGNYDRYDNQFKTRVRDIPVRADNTSHNTYLTIAAELGLVALLFYLFPTVRWLMLSIRDGRRLPQYGFWSWRLLGMLWLVITAHVIVSNFMDMFRFNEFGTTMWWLTLGLIANMVDPIQESGGLAVRNGDLSQ